MKAIKVILGVIVALTLVFFGTGFFVRETKYTAEVEINKPIEEVFALFESKEVLPKWMPEIKNIETVNETPQKIGSIYKLTIKNQDQEIKMQQKIRAYVPNEKFAYQFNSSEMIRIDDYNFKTKNNKTLLVQKSTVRANSFMLACTFPWFKGRLEKMSQEYMNQFKKIVEEN